MLEGKVAPIGYRAINGCGFKGIHRGVEVFRFEVEAEALRVFHDLLDGYQAEDVAGGLVIEVEVVIIVRALAFSLTGQAAGADVVGSRGHSPVSEAPVERFDELTSHFS